MLYSLLGLMLVLSQGATAFTSGVAQRGAVRRPSTVVRMAADDDPTGSPVIKMINKFQEALQDSPAAKAKCALAKLQAGEYDEAVVNAKLDSLISEPAVMFCAHLAL